MKKIFLILCLFATLFIISCASTPEDNATDSISAPQNDDVQTTDDSSENSDSQENEDEIAGGEEDDVILLDDDEVSTEYTDEYGYPIPEEFEEPLVLTIDSPKEDENQEEDNSEKIEFDAEDLKLLDNTEEDKNSENQTEDETTLIQSEDENENTDLSDDETVQTVNDTENETADGIISVEDDGIIDVEIDGESESKEDSFIENEEVPVPSRKVTLKKNEYVEITYPGTGWIFLGLTDGSRDIAYYGTKLGSKDTKFTLQARKSGTKILHFYKSDALTNEYIDDYVEVEVKNENGSNKTHIEAPEFKMPVPQIKKPAPAQIDSTEETENAASSETKDSTQNSTTKKTENNSETKSTQKNTTQTTSATSSLENTSAVNTSETSTQTSSKAETEQNSSTKSSTTQNESSSEYNSQTLLQEANILYNKKEFEAAKKKLDQYFLNPDSEIDRAYFLLGQVLESKSSIQNIKAALNAYTNVTKNYPASNYWEDANKRIIYLKRFYLEAR